MNLKLKVVAAMILAASISGSYALASDATPKKHKAKKAAPAPTCGSCDQIDALRRDLQNQIDGLKTDLASKDAALHQAQQQAADAQAAADKANAANAGLADNAAAVSSLQGTVNDLKANQLSLATTVSDETSKIKQQLEAPDTIHFKGITLSPTGSYVAAETVWRSAATGGDISTQLTGIPLEHSDAGQLSEFVGSGRQSRIALKAVGKISNATLTGYYEADWLGAGASSNNNQSNSYVLRQRQIWAQAALASGWKFTGGQEWSLATETTHLLDNGTEVTPLTIDPNYNAGFVWARQYGFRFSKDFGSKFAAGISVENPETLNPAGSGIPTNILLGQLGNNGGAYNAFNANISYNLTPDFIAKIAFEPGWGHWEVFNINRMFRDRIYPTGGTAFNDDAPGNGIGGGVRGPLAGKFATVGLKGLWGKGMGRYGDATIADVTIAPWGGIVPLKAFSGLGTLELTPNPRLVIYMNYGGDYVYRKTVGSWGYGSLTADMSGCNTEAPITSTSGGQFTPNTTGNCKGNTKDVQEATVGYWYDFYKGPKGRLRQGFQYSYFVRNLWSGVGGPLNPSGSAQGTDNVIETSFRYYLP
jgi:hypothetical protein